MMDFSLKNIAIGSAVVAGISLSAFYGYKWLKNEKTATEQKRKSSFESEIQILRHAFVNASQKNVKISSNSFTSKERPKDEERAEESCAVPRAPQAGNMAGSGKAHKTLCKSDESQNRCFDTCAMPGPSEKNATMSTRTESAVPCSQVNIVAGTTTSEAVACSGTSYRGEFGSRIRNYSK